MKERSSSESTVVVAIAVVLVVITAVVALGLFFATFRLRAVRSADEHARRTEAQAEAARARASGARLDEESEGDLVSVADARGDFVSYVVRPGGAASALVGLDLARGAAAEETWWLGAGAAAVPAARRSETTLRLAAPTGLHDLSSRVSLEKLRDLPSPLQKHLDVRAALCDLCGCDSVEELLGAPAASVR